MNKQFKKMIYMAGDLMYPRHCPVCFEIAEPRGELICPGCVRELVPVRNPTCKKCGKTVMHERMEYCLDCTRHPRTFEYNMALLEYNDCASRSMSAIKYKNRREYMDFYVQAACYRFGERIVNLHPDILVPVPIHPLRKRKRGFNQAALLARGMGGNLQIPVWEKALRRVKKTAPQKELNPSERLKNLEQAFAPGILPEGVDRALLVDDIYTTGSTLEACTKVLKTMGVPRVYTLTLFIGKGA